jgi:hypothetical protein
LDGFLGMVQGRPTIMSLIHFALLKLFFACLLDSFCIVKIVLLLFWSCDDDTVFPCISFAVHGG